MRAGSGVTHSEYNHSKTEPVHFLQIWIVPDARGLAPAYGQRPYDRAAAARELVLLASRDGRADSVQVHQDLDLWVTLLDAGQTRELPLRAGRHAWVHVARGQVSVNGSALKAGDGAAVTGDEGVSVLGREPAEVLIFDLA
jgi:quercetin 2,3-dioxygenase